MTKPSTKIQQLANLTTETDLSAPQESALPENLFPPVQAPAKDPTAPAPQLPSLGQTSRQPTDPAPQMPMLKGAVSEVRRKINPVERDDTAPELSETIVAMLVVAGLRARWVQNYWQVFLPDAHKMSENIGGAPRARWQTGVRGAASYEEWMSEINRFWKDVHPNEKLPFGDV